MQDESGADDARRRAVAHEGFRNFHPGIPSFYLDARRVNLCFRTGRSAERHKLLYLFDSYVLDGGRRELRRAGALVSVEPQVFDLLEYLIRNRERVVSKDDLIGAIWNGRAISESALSNRVNAARSAVHDSGKAQRLIRTLPRKGV